MNAREMMIVVLRDEVEMVDQSHRLLQTRMQQCALKALGRQHL